MSYYDGSSFSGESYDRHVFEANLSTVNKMQREYWTAKQVLKKKFGKGEDRHVVASDTEIDSKLSLFESIQRTCADLLKELDKYQSCICALARDENQLGRFLKDQGAQDKTQAGKMMAAVGKSLCYSAQQRLLLRHPLGRLHQDIETFRYRAISDTIMSIDKMEEERTHYRASLLWMQDISSNLDPEQYKKLEKFRKVQNEVRLNKEKFDRLKWAVCQKIDLLTASRSNLFSNTLVPYQDESLKFWEKTARTMSAVLESFKGYQHYEFKLLKGLNPMQELDSTKTENDEKSESEKEGEKNPTDNELISLHDTLDRDETGDDLAENLFQDALEALQLDSPADNQSTGQTKKDSDLLGDFTSNQESTKEDMDLLNDILGNNDQESTGDFANQWKSVFGDFVSAPQAVQSTGISVNNPANTEPFRGNGQPMPGQQQGQFPLPQAANAQSYLPSQLMDMHFSNFPVAPGPGMLPGMAANPNFGMTQQMMIGQQNSVPNPPPYSALFMNNQPQSQPQKQTIPVNQRKKAQDKGNMAAWYDLFAELDPLQNPDALGKKEGNKAKKQDGGAC